MNAADQKKTNESLPDGKQFSSLSDAVSVAAYVEQMLAAENTLIVNRLSWLFLSQSFCISAFVLIEIAFAQKWESPNLQALRVAVPALGIICCVVVDLATWAGTFERDRLADQRARLVQYINQHGPAQIPNLGGKSETRDHAWTQHAGSLPNRLLPAVLAAFWIVMLII
jgi:hypothetical protein